MSVIQNLLNFQSSFTICCIAKAINRRYVLEREINVILRQRNLYIDIQKKHRAAIFKKIFFVRSASCGVISSVLPSRLIKRTAKDWAKIVYFWLHTICLKFLAHSLHSMRRTLPAMANAIWVKTHFVENDDVWYLFGHTFQIEHDTDFSSE